MSAYQDITILHVEDDEIDQLALKRAFEKMGITNQIRVAKDGLEALKVLRGENGQEKITAPYIILLDLQMPRMNGMEFLRTLREDPELKQSIVFVFSTSTTTRDITQAYEHFIAGYISKQDAGKDFIELVQLIEKFKMTVHLPV